MKHYKDEDDDIDSFIDDLNDEDEEDEWGVEMSEGFCLSELGIDGKEIGVLYHRGSVKEFIKKLKEEIGNNDIYPWVIGIIDKLAGEVLRWVRN